jgi:hypothetical protein
MSSNQPVSGVIERTLWYETSTERLTIGQASLLTRAEPLIILGEAGMGKSHLLEWIAESQKYAFCTARQLINRHNPHTLLGDAECLVIDALDEVSAARDGDAVDLILRRLGELGYPRFVLSCRVSDWRSATGTEAILEQYAQRPTELFLEPFTDGDAIAFLSAELGPEIATSTVQHFSSRGLDGLLGNPQTLGLIARTAASGRLPESRRELFRRAAELLRVELRDSKPANQLDQSTAIDAAGAAFAALILTGNEAIIRKSAAHISEGEIAVSEVLRIPGGVAVETMLDTRLFKAYGPDRFSYLHRRIGEFLGAQWLAKLAGTPRKRRRLLALFHSHGLVPASLRGIHAWLAQDPALAQAVIGKDPLGVIEYGDTDTLPPNHARWLLDALQHLADSNPHFYDWGSPPARGLFQPGLIDDIRRTIVSPDVPFSLRLFLTKAARKTPAASSLAIDFRDLVLDPEAIFAIRHAAGEALIGFCSDLDEWRSIIGKLRDLGDELSTRLAIELLDEIGYHAADDEVISGLAVSHAVADDRTVGVLYPLEKELPIDRIDGVLDHFAAAARDLGEPHRRQGDRVLTDFAYNLIARRLIAGDVSPDRLWAWLDPFDASSGYQQEARKQLQEILRDNNDLRRSIQRQRILEADDEKNIWQRTHRLYQRSSGFDLTTEDIVELLQLLDPDDRTDERWRELVQLVRHDNDLGANVRKAACRFAKHRPDLTAWLQSLANPAQPEWQVKQAKRERRVRAKRATIRADLRRQYVANLQQVRTGDFQWILDPAMAYLRLFQDVRADLPAHERVEEWLGSEVAAAVHEGFEAFLMREPPEPSANDIAEGLAKNERWNGGYVIVAALAERVRNGSGLTALPDERLMAGFFVLQDTKVAHHAGIDDLETVIALELSTRDKLGDAMRLLCEPRLRDRREHIDGIYLVMRDEAYEGLGANLASEWLERFDDLPSSVEEEMISRLVRSGRVDDLRRLVLQRDFLAAADRRRNWDAAGLIADFERVSRKLASSGIDPDLLWHLRDLMATGRGARDPSFVKLNPAQIEWIVSAFRPFWPMASRPTGGWTGNRNSWEASDYLLQLLRRLGGDPQENAATALQRLLEQSPDAYTNAIRSIIAEQAMARVESEYRPPSLSAIEAITCDLPPETATDLQAVLIEELSIVQAKVRSDDAESWRGFFDDKGVPHNEERCRDHLLGLLRQGAGGIQYDPETHVAGDKEVDIACSAGPLRIPIEIKGQWNPQLWHGADTQLDRLYATDWRAERRGIYLVLWFGEQSQSNKILVGPGRGRTRPGSSAELQDALKAVSVAAQDGRTQIFVLDLTRESVVPD